MILLRKGISSDVDWISHELLTFSKIFDSRISMFGDAEYVRTGLLQVVEEHVVIIAVKDDVELAGFIIGLNTPHVFNPKIKLLTEIFWWVTESNRNTKAAIMLLQAFIEHGKKHADWVTFGLNKNTPVKSEAIIKRGFKLTETNYLLEVIR